MNKDIKKIKIKPNAMAHDLELGQNIQDHDCSASCQEHDCHKHIQYLETYIQKERDCVFCQHDSQKNLNYPPNTKELNIKMSQIHEAIKIYCLIPK